MTQSIQLSIIIVNWNLQALLEACLHSLKETITDVSYEVFVVDNHSSDDSVVMLHTKFSDVHIIRNKENIGFGRANNQAIARCMGEFVLLLNPDAFALDKSVSMMLNFMDSHAQIGALGPKIVNSDGSIQLACKRSYPSLVTEFISLSRLDRFLLNTPIFKKFNKKPDYDTAGDVEVLSGSCMMLRKACLQQIGGFDEQFFLYAEDVDLCYRIRQKGWRVYYYPEAIIKHHAHKASQGSLQFSPYVVSCHSMYLYFKKNSGILFAILYRVMVYGVSMVLVLLSIITLQFLKKKPLRNLSLYHDIQKLKWAVTLKTGIK